ncbi:hypothetical protein [Pseudomonas cremoricolorata]|uniref:Uncharacterized protein n=1 Tax=Pseudomonas cremoricolorata TaxID=157783 RepID=A0A089WWP7_9PSED|nr:hypothetical protein [Pseudomonas cremoricolorata]AIR91644.1 hypothetical protein LK03_21355 [Pseudomonas cremoricolorata]
MIQFVAQRMMEFDAKGLCGDSWYVESIYRVNGLDEYRDRLWQTCAAVVDAKNPKLTLVAAL